MFVILLLSYLQERIERDVAGNNAIIRVLSCLPMLSGEGGISKIIEFEISHLPFVNLKSQHILLEMTRL